MKRLLAILLSLVSIICVACTSTACGNEQQQQTELSEADKDILKYYREATIDDNFEDNSVYVILKSAYDDLTELSFKALKIVNKISRISYVDLYSKQIPYSKNGKIPLNEGDKNHMFDIVLEEHSKEKVLAVIDLLQTLDMVLSVGANFIRDDIVDYWVPSDACYDMQYIVQSFYETDMEKVWDITRGSTDIKIGVMENNIDMNHQDLKGRVFYGNYTPSATADNTHGTHVAGIIGAIQNDKGIAGIAECSMYLLSRKDFSGSIDFAKQNGIKIINASYGSESYDQKEYKALAEYDGLLIAGAGNDDNNNDEHPRYPASYNLPNIISVGAVDSDDKIAELNEVEKSNYGKTTVDLFAPGKDVLTTHPGDEYHYAHGTSMAAPFVTGVAALIYSLCPKITASEVKAYILDNVDRVDSLEDKCFTSGKLNAYKAVSAAYAKHGVSYKYYDEDQHWVICKNGDYTYTIEKHRFLPLGSSDLQAIIKPTLTLQCTKCFYIKHGNGLGEITNEEEDN